MGEATAAPTIVEMGKKVLSPVPFKEHKDQSPKLSFLV